MELTLLRLTPLAAGLSLVLLAACQRQATPEAAAPAIAPAPEVAAGTATTSRSAPSAARISPGTFRCM